MSLFKKQLPFILINIDITLNSSQLKQKLIDEMILLGTTLGGTQSESMFTVTKKDKNILKNICQIFFQSKNDTTTVQVTIKNSLNRYDRLIELKTTSGDETTADNLISTFLKKLVKSSKKIKIIKQSEGHFVGLETEINKSLQDQNKSLYSTLPSTSDENATILDSINKKASNYYEIYKILTQENYELGKSVSVFINEFKIKNQNIAQSVALLPSQMKEVITMVDSCVDTFNNYFNMGKSEDLVSCIRPAVEKSIFSKIYFILFDIYNSKYSEENKIFLSKIDNINNTMSIEDIMNYLEIKEKFRFLENYNTNSIIKIIPYRSTIDCINKIEYEQIPRIKFDTLISAGLDLRNTVLGGTQGKIELNSMDDELPIFIYIVTQSRLTNIIAELHMIEDYITYSQCPDKESKVLTNLMSAVLFINNTWSVNKK